MVENPAKDLLDRIFTASTPKDIRAARLDVVQARERGELTDAEERELLAAADDQLIQKGHVPG